MSFAPRRSSLSLFTLTACAVISIATSQAQQGWDIGEGTETQAFTLSEDSPGFTAGVDVVITAETFDVRGEVSRSLSVTTELTTVGLQENGRRPRVLLTLSDVDGNVLDEQIVRAGREDSPNFSGLDASALLADCDATEDCLAGVDITMELLNGGEVFGMWDAWVSVSMFAADPLSPPEGAEIKLVVIEEAS
jgi:hypothetical protein